MTRNTMRVLGFGIGLLAVAGAHAIEVAMWSSWFGGTHTPWFLNSGRAIVFTLAVLFGSSVLAGIVRVRGLPIVAGAVTAMIVVFGFGQGSTIFPIVLTAGAVLLSGASLFGAWLGSEIASWLFPRAGP